MTRFSNELTKMLAEEDDSYVVWAQGWSTFAEVERGK